MFGRKSDVNPLAARKQLLIAESELNRAQLRQEWRTLTDGLGSLSARARSFNTIASSTISLVTSFAAFTSAKPAGAKSSWLQKIVSGARLASAIWLAIRPRGSDSEKK